MRKITEVLRLKFDGQLSYQQIAQALGLSKGAVHKYVHLAQAKGLGWPLPEGMDEAALGRLLLPARGDRGGGFIEPDYGEMHQQLKRKGVTLQLLWSEYVDTHGAQAYRYTQFCQRYRHWQGRQRRSMRQVHRAGEKLFIDYCGPTVPVIDPDTGEVRAAQIFVAVLGASSYTFAEATWSQGLADWIGSHQRALTFFGGVPALLVPDNLRAGVCDPCRYTPQINPTYAEMARHYATAVLPARPRKPKDKAKAEAAVQLVERWILARLRHEQFFSLPALNAGIARLLADLNTRPFQGQSYSRRDLFESLDRPALGPLPEQAYDYVEWSYAKVNIDYHIQVMGRLYSVPHALVGQRVEVRTGASVVEVLHRGKRVAMHPRAGTGRFSTVPEHMPKAHRAHQQWTPGRLLNWGKGIGPATEAVVRHLLENRPHPEHGYRACLGLLNLSRRYERPRLEAACRRAVAIGAFNYRSISSILQKGLDRQPAPGEDNAAEGALPAHANLRGRRYYH